MPMPRYNPQNRFCLSCKKELIYIRGMGKDKWENKRFCDQKCNGSWHSSNKLGIHNPQTFSSRWKNRDKDSARKKMLGNKFRAGLQSWNRGKKGVMPSGESHHQWLGDDASYSAIHKWLINNFGKPTHCENKHCPKLLPIRFEYALISEEHTHSRLNYRMLCVQCHRSYDSRRNRLNVQL